MPALISRRDAIKLAGAAALLAAAKTEGVYGGAAPRYGAGSLGAFADGRYTLGKLPYAYDALEPLYWERVLKIHYGKHHAGYVKGLNKALERLAEARRLGDFGRIKPLSRALAFHGSGHVLHTLLWNSMTPGGSKVPAELAEAMDRDLGGIAAAKAHFAAATKAVEGSGWGVLAYEPVGGKLMILQAQTHQNLTIWGVVPLLVCDVWEHAYYLQYANDRGRWVDNFMKLGNWKFAARRYTAAARLEVRG